MRGLQAIGGVAIAVALLEGCSSERHSAVDGAVWSDDGLEVATYHVAFDRVRTWRVKGGPLIQDLDHVFALHVGVEGGASDREVTPARAGRPNALFYMRRSGYLLTDYDEGGARHFDRVHAITGERVEVRDPCLATSRVICSTIPSPDGATLALVEAPLIRATHPNLRVELRRSSDLARVASLEIEAANDGSAPSTWTTSGTFVIANGAATWALSADGGVAPADAPPCFEPPTYSSPVDDRGRQLNSDGTLSDLPGQPFGCSGQH